jgi:guanylate kinase
MKLDCRSVSVKAIMIPLLAARMCHAGWIQNKAIRLAPVMSLGLSSKSPIPRCITSTMESPLDESNTSSMVLDPLVVCGPSGVGKGTIIQKFMQEYGGEQFFGFTVSHTTRSPRPGEIDGIHYHFVSQDEMEELIRNHFFLEYAKVHGNWYGTSWRAIQDVQQNQNKRCLLDIDVQGVQALKQELQQQQHQKQSFLSETTRIPMGPWKPRFVFLAPPSVDQLMERLLSRGTEKEESRRRRIAMAQTEIDYGRTEGNFDAVLVNDDLERTCQEFVNTIENIYHPFITFSKKMQ